MTNNEPVNIQIYKAFIYLNFITIDQSEKPLSSVLVVLIVNSVSLTTGYHI